MFDGREEVPQEKLGNLVRRSTTGEGEAGWGLFWGSGGQSYLYPFTANQLTRLEHDLHVHVKRSSIMRFHICSS